MFCRPIFFAISLVAIPLTLGYTPLALAGSDHSHDHGDHSHDADDPHMQAMEKLRQALKAKLGAQYDQTVPSASAEQLATGKKKYEQFCVTCHGVSGKGDGPAAVALKPPPADFTDPMHASFYSDRGRIEIIKSGSPGTTMTGWSAMLKEDEILAVYQYVRSFRDKAAKTPAKQDAAPKHKHDHAHGHDH